MTVLTSTEAARFLKVKPARLYDLARADLIPHTRIGRQLRFSREALEEFIASGGKALPGGWRRQASDDSPEAAA